MAVLNSSQRNTLEKAVLAARRVSEQGAVNALKAFAVHHHEPYAHMSGEERALRNHLRSKARLLGDHTTKDGGHSINKLAYELAYEYWHRMLFARFLEANDLLIHPEHQMAVSLEECEELADEEGHEDKWVAAAYYASKMLPAIFRQDDPLIEVKFATEDRIKLEQILEDLKEEIYRAEDSLGWVYQYWQSEAKETINASGDKIDGEKLPAVTQLFTEPYMVHFLIDNTLGAWWTARHPGITPPIEFRYLRTLDDGTPAAGKFEGLPDDWKDITMIDPCMGSGHFVVEVFKVIAALRIHDEGLSIEEACDVTIRENIHGLELDDRCTQIAAFNLALTAWKFCGRYRELPEMNLACCGIAPKGRKEDWVKLANAEPDPTVRARLKGGLERMYDLFQKAPELGSLIDPTDIQKDAFTSDFSELEPFLERALAEEINSVDDYDRGIIAAGISNAGKLLAKKYTLILTNVPFKELKQLGKTIRDYVDNKYSRCGPNLATIMMARILKMLNQNSGNLSLVTPHEWLFLVSYNHFREFLLKKLKFSFVIDLGEKAFRSSQAAGAFTALVSISNYNLEKDSFLGIDATKEKSLSNKRVAILNSPAQQYSNENQLLNPDYRIGLFEKSALPLLSKYADSYVGLQNGDSGKFLFFFWECNLKSDNTWDLLQLPCSLTKNYTGREGILRWENGIGELSYSDQAFIKGKEAWGKLGVAIRQTRSLPATLYVGNLYDQSSAVIIPKDENHLLAIWSFCKNPSFHDEVRKIDKKKNVTNATLVKIPFDLVYWQKLADKEYPVGLPKPYSNDPTQWLFHSHPKFTESPLQVTIARLLGYQWPAEYDDDMKLAEEAKEKIKAIHELALPFDEDGIVCIPPVNGEPAAADRIREQIIKVWGEEYDASTIKSLLQQEGSKKRDFDSYLRDEFFSDHCKLFKNRPFIWHIWDGRKDGFSALVNYHKLDKSNLEKLIYTYLGDWIRQCELKLQNGISGADGLLAAAKQLKGKLLLILKGEPPYDLFIRWKPIEEQPIGWDPDINDGVRLNVYPFVNAGVLRKNFNVNWSKDRGKNPSGSPWGPDRHNRYEDLDDMWKLKDEDKKVIPHLTTDVKRKARESLKSVGNE